MYSLGLRVAIAQALMQKRVVSLVRGEKALLLRRVRWHTIQAHAETGLLLRNFV